MQCRATRTLACAAGRLVRSLDRILVIVQYFSMAERSAGCDYEGRKERGNCCFRQRQYDAACVEYSAALTCAASDAQRAVALNNRALARLEMGEHASAVEDCTAVLAVDPANVCRPPSLPVSDTTQY